VKLLKENEPAIVKCWLLKLRFHDQELGNGSGLVWLATWRETSISLTLGCRLNCFAICWAPVLPWENVCKGKRGHRKREPKYALNF